MRRKQRATAAPICIKAVPCFLPSAPCGQDNPAIPSAPEEGAIPADQDTGTYPSVRLERVTKRFGDLTAVRELTLDIERGEFFTMLGPSGCGKTTTLRMVAGFEEPSDGAVLLDGDDVTGLPAFKRPTNTVFQSYALFPHLSVERNVAFGLERKKVDRAKVKT